MDRTCGWEEGAAANPPPSSPQQLAPPDSKAGVAKFSNCPWLGSGSDPSLYGGYEISQSTRTTQCCFFSLLNPILEIEVNE